MKKILIALDYNHAADKVAETGYNLARTMRADVTLIHVITEPAYYAMDFSPVMGYEGGYTNGTVAVAEDIKKDAESFLTAFVNYLDDKRVQTKVLEGETTDCILKYSEEWGADLIVMGSHSHKGISGLFVTDVAALVLKNSRIPLLAIPTEDK